MKAAHASHVTPTRGGMGTAPVTVTSTVVVHLSTGDIVVTTYSDGAFTVKADPVAKSNNVDMKMSFVPSVKE